MPRPLAAASLVLAALLAACGGRPATTPADAGADVFIPAPPSNELDVLFVIDNSNSSVGEGPWTMHAADIEALVQSLASSTKPLGLHVGVVSTDLGAGRFTPPSCDTVGGDQGLLQNTPKGAQCPTAHLTDASQRFLSFSVEPGGAVTAANFVGNLDGAFDCYAAMGTGGCGFEHVLGSMRAALEGCESPSGCTQAANEGFLRPDAYLAIIILTDEDDCSAPADSTLFDPTHVTLASPLGPLTSYRCFEFGVLCGGADVGRAEGPRQDCAPGDKDPDPRHRLTPVGDFARALTSLKPVSPRMVYVAVVAGPPMPVQVGLDANGYPDLRPSCTSVSSADPGIRLEAFTRQFYPDRGRFFDICEWPTATAIAEVGADLANALRGD